jgi:hypothetical protein
MSDDEKRELMAKLESMHRIVFPGEYGLGSEEESIPDDKKAWEKLGDLLNETILIAQK